MRHRRLAAVLAVAALLVTAKLLHVFERLRDPPQLARTLVELGASGYLVFILAYALLQPFGVPGTVFIVAAPLIWPWPIAFALSMIGTMAASVVGFSFARFVARDWMSARVPERFKKYEAALERRGFATVVTLRFVFWMPPLLHAFFGVSRVPGWTHFWGSLVGYVVPLFMVSFFGERLFVWVRALPPRAIALVLLLVAALVLVTWLTVRARRATSREPATESSTK